MGTLRAAIIVDDSKQSYLNYDLYRRSLSTDKYSIEFLIVQKSFRTSSKSLMTKVLEYVRRRGIKKLFGRIFFAVVEKFEGAIVKRNQTYKKLYTEYTLDDFDVPKVYVTPSISPSGLIYRYTDEDIKRIKELKLDVLIRGGSGILRGDILDLCKYGVISFHHANNDVNRGGPPGFWEVFYREPSTGFIIQRLLSELDGGDVLFKGSISTSFLYWQNHCRLYIKSSVFMHQLLEKLATNPNGLSVFSKTPYAYPLYTTPTLSEVFLYVSKTFFYGLKKIVGKLSNKSYRWGVSYQFVKDWKSAVLWKSITIKNPPYRFLADPFAVTQQGKSVIFLEDYDYKSSRGKISAYEVNPSNYKELGVALEEDFHLSYPFLFRHNNDLYMVPESCEPKQIRLYKCVDFPLKWELHKVLVDDIDSADTSIFKLGNRWWLFTNKDSSELGDHGSELHIFYADTPDSTSWQAHPLNPVIFDSLCARNGGLIFDEDGIYRVFQRQGFDMYGESMGVAKINELTPISYSEEILFNIPGRFFKGINGTHTYSYESGLLTFDFVKYENFKS